MLQFLHAINIIIIVFHFIIANQWMLNYAIIKQMIINQIMSMHSGDVTTIGIKIFIKILPFFWIAHPYYLIILMWTSKVLPDMLYPHQKLENVEVTDLKFHFCKNLCILSNKCFSCSFFKCIFLSNVSVGWINTSCEL